MSILAHFPKVAMLVGKMAYFLSKNAPTIMTYTGVITLTASAGVAIKKSVGYNTKIGELSLQQTIDELGEQSVEELTSSDDMSPARKTLYKKVIFNTAKYYALPAVFGAAGVGLILGAHHLAARRLAALTASYASLYKSYLALSDDNKKLKEVVKDRVPKTKVDDEVRSLLGGEPKYSYVRTFDHTTSSSFERGSDMLNEAFLSGAAKYLNVLLQTQGVLTMREVLLYLGMEPTPQDMTVGWIADWREEFDPNQDDGYIQFAKDNNLLMVRDTELNEGCEAYGYHLNFNASGDIQSRIR